MSIIVSCNVESFSKALGPPAHTSSIPRNEEERESKKGRSNHHKANPSSPSGWLWGPPTLVCDELKFPASNISCRDWECNMSIIVSCNFRKRGALHGQYSTHVMGLNTQCSCTYNLHFIKKKRLIRSMSCLLQITIT